MGLNLDYVDYVSEHIDLVLGYTQLPAVSVLSAQGLLLWSGPCFIGLAALAVFRN